MTFKTMADQYTISDLSVIPIIASVGDTASVRVKISSNWINDEEIFVIYYTIRPDGSRSRKGTIDHFDMKAGEGRYAEFDLKYPFTVPGEHGARILLKDNQTAAEIMHTDFSNVINISSGGALPPPAEPESGLWSDVKSIWDDALMSLGWTFGEPMQILIKTVYNDTFKSELRREELVNLAADFLGVNALIKLATGKNITGKADKFGGFWDVFDLATLPLFFTPFKTGILKALKVPFKLPIMKIFPKLGKAGSLKIYNSVRKGAPEDFLKVLDDYPETVRGFFDSIDAGGWSAIASKTTGKNMDAYVRHLRPKTGMLGSLKVYKSMSTGHVDELGPMIDKYPDAMASLFKALPEKQVREAGEKAAKLINTGKMEIPPLKVGLLFEEISGRTFNKAVTRGLTQSEIAWVVKRVSDNPLRAVTLFVREPDNWLKVGPDVQKAVFEALARSRATFSKETIKILTDALVPKFGEAVFRKAGLTAMWKRLPTSLKLLYGFIGGSLFTGFAADWSAKEWIWEQMSMSIDDAIRDERWDDANLLYPALLEARKYIGVIFHSLGWLNPVINWIFIRGLEGCDLKLTLWHNILEREGRVVEAPGVITEPEAPGEPGEPPATAIDVWLRVESIPQGAGIYVDGKTRYTKTNLDVLMQTRPEPYFIQLTAPSGYKNPPGKSITITEDKHYLVDFMYLEEIGAAGSGAPTPPEPPATEPKSPPAAEPTKAYLTIDSAPRGATIWIDGENTWTMTPFSHLLEEGKHNIQLQLLKWKPGLELININGGENQLLTVELIVQPDTEPEEPFIPQPIDVSLEPETEPVIKPNAWEYTITARAADTGGILNAKIIIDGIYTGKYTTNSVILEPESEYLLRLEAFGYDPAEVIIQTSALPE